MKRAGPAILFSLLVLGSTSCGGSPAPVPLPSATPAPDPCSAKMLPLEVDQAHAFMREFDDASALAANTPRSQLPLVISEMQSIRRAAEDQSVPACLEILKKLQLSHMNTVIDTLLAFLGGADQNTVNQGTELARQEHNAYALEYARLLGLTLVAPATPVPGPTPTETPTAPVTLAVFNPGPSNANIFSEASLGSSVVGVLAVGGSARLVRQGPEGQWIQVEIPNQAGQLGWIQASLVTISPLAP